jgi:hypothetical protein
MVTQHRVLKPGGWVQMVEAYHQVQSDNGSITEGSATRQWSEKYIRAMEVDKDPRAAMQLQAMLNAAGMVEVESRMMPLPLSDWSTSECPEPPTYICFSSPAGANRRSNVDLLQG